MIDRLLRRLLADLRAGRPRLLLALMADDIHFRFLGEHSWAADFHGKERARQWLRRYVDIGLQLHAREVVVSGPPWDMTICIWFTDHATAADGQVVYRNEGVLVERVRRGRITQHTSFVDTQRTAAFDDYLRSVGRL